MNSAENRARSAMRAIASTIDDAPPLRLAPEPGATSAPGRWMPRGARGWMAPLSAAVAMLVLGITLAIVRNVPNGTVVPAIPAFSHGVPNYYVALDGPTYANPAAKVVVGDTVSGKRLFTLGPFAGGGAVDVSAAADGLTFVVGTQSYKTGDPTSWYLIRITSGSSPKATVRALPIPEQAPGINSMALSPDGTELALIEVNNLDVVILRIYSVATGALLRQWTGALPQHTIAWWREGGTLWWTDDGHELGWGYYDGSAGENRSDVWLTQVTRPGNHLFADSRLVLSTPVTGTDDAGSKRALSCSGASSMLPTGDGKTIVCGAQGVFRNPASLPKGVCPAVAPWDDVGFLEYSTATGKLARTLYSDNTSCIPDTIPAQVLWASDTGDTVIGLFDFGERLGSSTVIRFGIFREHNFTPLPVPTSTDPGTIAW